MGLFDFVKKQFIDVIHWTDDSQGLLAYRVPMQDFEIQNGAQLTVRESQVALFIDEGHIADQFNPGRYTLNTQTLPVLTNLKNWDKLFDSPFKSDVYFFNTTQQLNRQWGTSNPITLRDAEFGSLRLRAFGIYSYRLQDPKIFYREVSGSKASFSADELDGQLTGLVISALSEHIASSNIPFLDLASQQSVLGDAVRQRLQTSFAKIGLQLEQFVIQNLSLPEELQKILDQRIGIKLAGNLQDLTQYQTAQSIPIAAANEGGIAGVGAGLGAGIAMAEQMAKALQTTSLGNTSKPDHVSDTSEDPLILLEKLHNLMTKGIITEEEFASKKADLLKKI